MKPLEKFNEPKPFNKISFLHVLCFSIYFFFFVLNDIKRILTLKKKKKYTTIYVYSMVYTILLDRYKKK